MSFTMPLSNMPEDPFTNAASAPAPGSVGQPSFYAQLQQIAYPLPTKAELFRTKEVDSGVIYAETPTDIISIGSLKTGTPSVLSTISTPPSSIVPLVSDSYSIIRSTRDGFPQAQIDRLVADQFKYYQLIYPRLALVFVGK